MLYKRCFYIFLQTHVLWMCLYILYVCVYQESTSLSAATAQKNVPAHRRGVGPEDPERSPPPQTILWLYNYLGFVFFDPFILQ